MKSAVVLFPGLNRDHDMIAALKKISGHFPKIIRQDERHIPNDIDLIVIPGGFSYGDYLRAGAIGARMPVVNALLDAAKNGKKIMGICNGFQILLEAKLLPGALMRNSSLHFVCREVYLKVENVNSVFTKGYAQGEIIRCPVAHHDGNYFADVDTVKRIEENDQVVFRYARGTNPNGSINDIAGIISKNGNILGMMPHPENMIETIHGCEDGRALFEGAMDMLTI